MQITRGILALIRLFLERAEIRFGDMHRVC